MPDMILIAHQLSHVDAVKVSHAFPNTPGPDMTLIASCAVPDTSSKMLSHGLQTCQLGISRHQAKNLYHTNNRLMNPLWAAATVLLAPWGGQTSRAQTAQMSEATPEPQQTFAEKQTQQLC